MNEPSSLEELRVEIARGATSLQTEEGRAFLRDRLALFASWSFALGFGFYLINLSLAYRLLTGGSVGRAALHPGALFHLAGALVTGITWLILRARRWSPTALRTVDVIAVVGSCTCYALMGAALAEVSTSAPLQAGSGPFSGMLACTNVVLARAVIVPSTAARTGLVSAIAMAPMVILTAVAAFGSTAPTRFAWMATITMTAWGGVGAIVATVGSRVIFGLRREAAKVRRLGQYTIEEKLGEGAMGVVYKARHAMLRRPTAIKLLPPERAGEENVRRFEREVQLTAQLTHPNTVAIYDYGRTPDGVFYYAMEFLPGFDLNDLVREHGPQPAGRVIHMLQQACGALAEAHAAGLIHRDIKPANILLTERGGEPDVVKLLDFGLVKHLDLEGAEATRTSLAPVLAGTPLYLSPEAIRSEQLVDGRSDIYGLGGVGYFLLCGRPVFEGASVIELCSHHLQSPPTPPSTRVPGIPGDLEEVILICLAKAPEARFPTVQTLLAALKACGSANDWDRDRAAEWWETHRAGRRQAVSTAPKTAQTIAVDVERR